jgi:twinkle protein
MAELLTDDTDWAVDSAQPEDVKVIEPFHDGAADFPQRLKARASGYLAAPWDKAHDVLRFEPGRWTIWSGATFSGKTQLLRQIALHAAKVGQPVLFMSLEEEARTVRREFAFMAAHTRTPDDDFVDVFASWASKRIYVANTMELLTPETMLRLVAYAVSKLGVRHIFVDSLMRLAMRKDDYDGQRQLGNLLGRFVRMRGCHLHMVVHPSKAGEWGQPINPYNIGGAQDLIAQADNLVTLFRAHEPPIPQATNILRVWKQRGDTDWIGEIDLWYDVHSRQFLGGHGHKPMRWFDWHQYPAVAA